VIIQQEHPDIAAAATTGQAAWLTTCELTEPVSRLANPPAPREPTTIRSASRDASMSDWEACPLTARTVTDSGRAPSWLMALSTASCAACWAFSSAGRSSG
jgi:hypothetical protein